jgi:uncharacterized paraquat-inducible protein A
LEVSLLMPPNRTHTQPLLSTYLVDFSFAEMVRDFWRAGAKLVTLIILFGSCIIPITKHLYLLFAFTARMSPASERARHVFLVLFDQLGRTAFVDLFLMGYVICVFYTRVDQDLLGIPVLRIQLVNLPVRGLFLGLGSTICSGVLGQVLIWMHTNQQNGDFEHQVTVATGPPTASLLQRLCAYHSSGTKASRFLHTHLSAMLVTVLLLGGCALFPFLPSAHLVSFQLSGLAGEVANAPWLDFDLLTVTRDMTAKSEQDFGTKVLIAVYYTTTLVVPAIMLFVGLVIWFIPLHLKVQRLVLSLFPMWFAWCALDTLLVTTFAAYLELHLIGEFTFDHRFGALCSEVRQVLGVPCVALNHHIHSGMFILLAACLVFFSIFVFIAHLGAKVLETAKVGTESPNTLLWARPWERESPLVIPGEW